MWVWPSRNSVKTIFCNQTWNSGYITIWSWWQSSKDNIKGQQPVIWSILNNKANLNVNIDYIGDRKDINFENGDRVTLDDYTLVNAAINYQLNDKIKIFAKFNNILDEEYQDVFAYETSEFSGFAGLELTL